MTIHESKKSFQEYITLYKEMHGSEPSEKQLNRSSWEIEKDLQRMTVQHNKLKYINSEKYFSDILCGAHTNKTMAEKNLNRERKIAKVSGSQNLTALNNWGRMKVMAEESIAENAKKYQVHHKRKFNFSTCEK